MGISIDEPSFVFEKKLSVLANTYFPHSTLNKKSSSIAFQFIRKGIGNNGWLTTYLNTNLNLPNMLKKSLPGGEKRSIFTPFMLHYTGE